MHWLFYALTFATTPLFAAHLGTPTSEVAAPALIQVLPAIPSDPISAALTPWEEPHTLSSFQFEDAAAPSAPPIRAIFEPAPPSRRMLRLPDGRKLKVLSVDIRAWDDATELDEEKNTFATATDVDMALTFTAARGLSGVVPDFAVLDHHGQINTVLSNASEGAPVAGFGRYLLVLPRGDAGGLREGERVTGLHIPYPPRQLAAVVRARADGAETVLDEFLDRFEVDGDDHRLLYEATQTELKKDQRMLERFSAATFEMYPEESFIAGLAARATPRLWRSWIRQIGSPLPPLADRATIWIHEGGHYLAARVVGAKHARFYALPNAQGAIYFDERRLGPTAKVAIALAGPLTQAFAGALLLASGAIAFAAAAILILNPIFALLSLKFATNLLRFGWNVFRTTARGGLVDWVDAARELGWERTERWLIDGATRWRESPSLGFTRALWAAYRNPHLTD